MSGKLIWSDFIETCKACTDCGLAATRRNVVIYRGSVRAPLMIVGEGPGEQEDETGIPFVGAAGKLLDLLLDAFGISSEYYHICNIVKCRPPGNRVPSPEESAACRKHFATQFRFVKPAVILLLGSTAFKNFTGSDEGITKVRGKWIEKNGYLIMPTVHPAYVLRNNNARADMWNDLEMVRSKLEELGVIEPLETTPAMPSGRR
ncbi:MAG: uracil-DNA glycosylase [Eubacteriales bacterium]|nr:uracil-DNA glycosylase [Eubacteriales bacterium]